MTQPTVLRLDSSAEQKRYRQAVAQILNDIKQDMSTPERPCTWVDIAESINVSVETIRNAKDQANDLSAVYLMRLGCHYGAGYLNPFLRLADAQVAPLDGTLTSDILPMVMAVAHKIAMARDPAGPGGATEVPQERRGYLPDLKRLQNRAGCLIQEIEVAA